MSRMKDQKPAEGSWSWKSAAAVGLFLAVGASLAIITALKPVKRKAADVKSTSIGSGKVKERETEAKEIDVRKVLQRKLLADPNFQISTEKDQDNAVAQVEARIKQVFMQAMWDSVAEDMRQGNADRILVFLEELKGRMKALTPNRQDLAREVDDAIDLDMLKSQFEHGTDGHRLLEWDLLPIAKYIVGKIRALEAPARNEVTDSWFMEFLLRANESITEESRLKTIRELIDFAHEKLDLISVDSANAYFRSIGPLMQQHGIEFFEKEFRERVEKDGLESLKRTIEWISKVEADILTREGKESLAKMTTPELHRSGILELVLPGGVFKLENLDEESLTSTVPIPETLEVEIQTLQDLFLDARKVWRTAYAILRIRQIVPGASNAMLDEVHGILKAQIDRYALASMSGGFNAGIGGNESVLARIGAGTESKLVSDAVVECVKRHHELGDIEESALSGMLRKGFDFTNLNNERTFSIVGSRLRGIVISLVKSGATSDRKRFLEALFEALKKIQLGPMVESVGGLVFAITTLADRDFKIHGAVGYAPLIQNQRAKLLGHLNTESS